MATTENDNLSNIGEEQPKMISDDEPNEDVNVPTDTNEATEHPRKSVRRFAKCKYCNKKLTGRSNDGTTHLKDHYAICLSKKTRDIRQHILVQGQKTTDGKAYMSKYSFDAEVSKEELAKMIIIHDYPLSIVEHYGFRSFIHVSSPHTADVLSQAMMECLLDWNIENKLSTLTLDNCSTNDAIIDKLLGMLTTSSLILKGRLFHMRCCAHIINIIVQDGFSVIGDAIENVRNSVAFWTASPKRVQDFKLSSRQAGVDCQKELILDCKTRWNSIYMMLNVALEYKDVFTRLSKKEKNYACLPSEDEWKMASVVCEKLQLFYHVTEKFSGTKYPTSNIFFPLICEMKLSLLSWQESINDVIRSMVSTMLIKFDKYWSVIHDVMSIAIILDPRYKLKLINYLFPKIYGDNARGEVVRIRNIFTELFEEYKKKHDNTQGSFWKRQCRTDVSEGGSSTHNKPSWEMDFESMLGEDTGFEKTELDDYLAEKLLPNEKGFDILVWWKCNGSKFPVLQLIARDVLAIPISSVASESAFSMSGNKVTKQRSRLKSETVGALMCSQSWLRKELEDKKQGEPKAFDQTVAYDDDVA